MTVATYNPELKILRVPSAVLKELDALMDDNRKIAAIKLLRSSTGCGLAEAKHAIEKKFQGHNSPDAFEIKCIVTVKSVTVDFGEGDVVLSIDDLQMMTLVNMTSIGIDETRRILDLHSLLSSWQGDNNE